MTGAPYLVLLRDMGYHRAPPETLHAPKTWVVSHEAPGCSSLLCSNCVVIKRRVPQPAPPAPARRGSVVTNPIAPRNAPFDAPVIMKEARYDRLTGMDLLSRPGEK
jgi:hypothetical protein